MTFQSCEVIALALWLRVIIKLVKNKYCHNSGWVCRSEVVVFDDRSLPVRLFNTWQCENQERYSIQCEHTECVCGMTGCISELLKLFGRARRAHILVHSLLRVDGSGAYQKDDSTWPAYFSIKSVHHNRTHTAPHARCFHAFDCVEKHFVHIFVHGRCRPPHRLPQKREKMNIIYCFLNTHPRCFFPRVKPSCELVILLQMACWL